MNPRRPPRGVILLCYASFPPGGGHTLRLLSSRMNTGTPAGKPFLCRHKVLFCLVLLLSMLLPFRKAAGGEGAAVRRLVVSTVASRDLAPYKAAREGFRETLDAAGYQVFFVTYNLDGDASNMPAVTSGLSESPPDLILTLGTFATQEVSRAVSKTPIVFAMVMEPESSGLTSGGRATQANLTGVTMDISMEKQLDALQKVLPDTRRVGVLYNPDESEHMLATIQTASSARGLVIVGQEVSSSNEVARAFRTLSPRVDVLMAIPDATVYTESGIRYLLLNALRQAQPFVGLLESFVEAGALMGLGLDYRDLGRQAGELAAKIEKGISPGQISVCSPRKTLLLLNLRTARRIAVSLPDEVLEAATVVVQ